MKLYHGSAHLVEELKASTPRGDNQFNSKKGIYTSSNFTEAALYALARNKESTNRSWGVKFIDKKPFLILKKEKWSGPDQKYKLNDVGYVYEVNCKAVKNPDKERRTEHRIDKDNIRPLCIHVVTPHSIKKSIKYVCSKDWDSFWS